MIGQTGENTTMKFIQRKVYQLTPGVRVLVALGDDGNVCIKFLIPSDNAKEIGPHEYYSHILGKHYQCMIAELFSSHEDMGQAEEVTA